MLASPIHLALGVSQVRRVWALIIIPLALPAVAQAVELTGSIQGYFLTSAGQLRVRTVAIGGMPAQATSERLYPLWSSYYLCTTIRAASPIQHIRVIASADRAILYDAQLPTPTAELRLPPQDPASLVTAYLGAHSKHGLAWRIELTDTSGHTSHIAAQVTGAKLLPMPELRIDWLDLLRIDAVRRILRDKGDAILPGLRGDACAYALVSDDGQMVLFNHPHPPSGFRRYRGPLPIRETVWVGRRPPGDSSTELTEMLGDRPTVYLQTCPRWCALWTSLEYNPDRRFDSESRVPAIVHEICHACWFRSTGFCSYSLTPDDLMLPTLRERSLEAAAREALMQAGTEVAPDRKLALVRDHLALDDCRRQSGATTTERRAGRDKLATTEGFAHWANSVIAERLGTCENDAELRVDPFFTLLDSMDNGDDLARTVEAGQPQTAWLLDVWAVTIPTLYGQTYARLLDRLAPAQLRNAWVHNQSLRDAVAAASGYSKLSEAERNALQREALVGWHVAQRETAILEAQSAARDALLADTRLARTGQGLVLRWLFPLDEGEVGPLGRGAQPSQALNGLFAAGDGYRFLVHGPCVVKQSAAKGGGTVEVRTVLKDPDGGLVRGNEGESLLQSKSAGLKFDVVRAQTRRSANCLTVDGLHLSKPAIQWGDPGTTNFEGVYIPLTWLRLTSAAHTPLSEAQTLTVHLTGNFYNEDTQQIEYHVWDLAEESNREWDLIGGESYYAATALSAVPPATVSEISCYAPDGKLVGHAAAAAGAHLLTAAGSFTASYRLFGAFRGVDWDVAFNTERNGHPSGSVTFKPRPDSPQQHTSSTVCALDSSGSRPFPGAQVSIWPEGHDDERLSAATNSQGDAPFGDIRPGRYTVEIGDPEGGCHYRLGGLMLAKGTKPQMCFRVAAHCGILGRVTLNGAAKDLKIELLKDGRVVQNGTVSAISTDGAYSYAIGPHPAAGQYTVRATYTGAGRLANGVSSPQVLPATVPDDCSAYNSLPNVVELNPGAHSPVVGPNFDFGVINGAR